MRHPSGPNPRGQPHLPRSAKNRMCAAPRAGGENGGWGTGRTDRESCRQLGDVDALPALDRHTRADILPRFPPATHRKRETDRDRTTPRAESSTHGMYAVGLRIAVDTPHTHVPTPSYTLCAKPTQTCAAVTEWMRSESSRGMASGSDASASASFCCAQVRIAFEVSARLSCVLL